MVMMPNPQDGKCLNLIGTSVLWFSWKLLPPKQDTHHHKAKLQNNLKTYQLDLWIIKLAEVNTFAIPVSQRSLAQQLSLFA